MTPRRLWAAIRSGTAVNGHPDMEPDHRLSDLSEDERLEVCSLLLEEWQTREQEADANHRRGAEAPRHMLLNILRKLVPTAEMIKKLAHIVIASRRLVGFVGLLCGGDHVDRLRRWAFSGIVGDHAVPPGSTFGRRQEDMLSSEERPRPGSGHSSRTVPGSLRPRAFEVNDSPQPDPPCWRRAPRFPHIAGRCSARTFPSPPRTERPASAAARSHLRLGRCR